MAQQIFNLTTTEAALMLLLLQNSDVSRERIDMSQRTIDVHICHIRRQLLPHGIEIETLRGYGYQLSREHRRKAMALIGVGSAD